MITEDMIHGPGARPPRRRIQNDTPIVPRAVAEAVWEETLAYLQIELPRQWVRRLTIRANMVYLSNDQFHKLVCKKGNAGRDWLWAFTRHWLAALIREYHPELHARLLGNYNVGRELSHRS